jgi:hypothetical protein
MLHCRQIKVRAKEMKKTIAIIGALIAGGLGIAVASAPQAAHAAMSTN